MADSLPAPFDPADLERRVSEADGDRLFAAMAQRAKEIEERDDARSVLPRSATSAFTRSRR